LDEPFVSLDAPLAERLRAELVELVSRKPVTTLLVTHSMDEAIGLADRILLLSASPARILADVPIVRPRSARSADETALLTSKIREAVNSV
jgi:ABC-type nitrate/sulfonate/bicarbonate transport system ATPase subunit